MSDDQEQQQDVSGAENGDAPDGDAAPRFRFRRPWSEIRSSAPLIVFVSWTAMVVLVAIARIDPWNEWRSWRKWLRADERGWELLIPGLLGVGATWLFIWAHDRWSDEGWSPEVLGMVLLGSGAAFGCILWGLHALSLRPFAG